MMYDTIDKDVFVTASQARPGSPVVRNARGQCEVCWKQEAFHDFGCEFAALGWHCGPCEAAVDRTGAPKPRSPVQGPWTAVLWKMGSVVNGAWGQVHEPQCEILSSVTVSQPSENTTIKKLGCLWCQRSDPVRNRWICRNPKSSFFTIINTK